MEPKLRLLLAVARARGSYDRAMDRLSREAASRPVGELTATIRANADSGFAVAGVGPRGPLTDVLVHTVDLALPLGPPYDADPAAARAALEFLTTGRAGAFVPRGRVDDLRLEAPDAQFTYGTGPDVAGHGIELLAAVCGRTAVLDRLDGPGGAVLAERIGGPPTR